MVDNLQIIHLMHCIKVVICFFYLILAHKFAIIQVKKGGNMATIDYAKYSNMSERQLLNSLLNAEKKEAKLRAEFQERIKNSTELIKFLKAKLNEKLNKERYYTIENSPALNTIKNSFENLSKKDQDELKNELEAVLNDEAILGAENENNNS